MSLTAFPPQHQIIDKAHDRLEIRQIWTSTDLNDYLNFPHVGQVFTIRREITRIKQNKTTVEIIQGATSLAVQKADPVRLLHSTGLTEALRTDFIGSGMSHSMKAAHR